MKFSRETECPNLGSYRLVSCMNMITLPALSNDVKFYFLGNPDRNSFVLQGIKTEEYCWVDHCP